MGQGSEVAAPAVFTGRGESVPKHENMSLFERLNAEKGLQLPVFGTPVLSACLAMIYTSFTYSVLGTMMLNCVCTTEFV